MTGQEKCVRDAKWGIGKKQGTVVLDSQSQEGHRLPYVCVLLRYVRTVLRTCTFVVVGEKAPCPQT
jgi:hypothetical protein